MVQRLETSAADTSTSISTTPRMTFDTQRYLLCGTHLFLNTACLAQRYAGQASSLGRGNPIWLLQAHQWPVSEFKLQPPGNFHHTEGLPLASVLSFCHLHPFCHAALEGNCGEGTSSTCTAPGQSAQAQFPSCSSRRDRWQMTGAVHLQSCNTLLSRLSAELLPVLQAKQWEMASPSPLVQTQPFKYHRAHTEDVLSTWYLQEQLPSWNST